MYRDVASLAYPRRHDSGTLNSRIILFRLDVVYPNCILQWIHNWSLSSRSNRLRYTSDWISPILQPVPRNVGTSWETRCSPECGWEVKIPPYNQMNEDLHDFCTAYKSKKLWVRSVKKQVIYASWHRSWLRIYVTQNQNAQKVREN